MKLPKLLEVIKYVRDLGHTERNRFNVTEPNILRTRETTVLLRSPAETLHNHNVYAERRGLTFRRLHKKGIIGFK